MGLTKEEISVTYKFVDGMHFFVPADKKAAGLCAAHKDLEVAYNEAGTQLSNIVSFNSGKDVSYVPAIPFEQFKKLIDAYQAVTKLASDYDISAAITQSWIHNIVQDRELV